MCPRRSSWSPWRSTSAAPARYAARASRFPPARRCFRRDRTRRGARVRAATTRSDAAGSCARRHESCSRRHARARVAASVPKRRPARARRAASGPRVFSRRGVTGPSRSSRARFGPPSGARRSPRTGARARPRRVRPRGFPRRPLRATRARSRATARPASAGRSACGRTDRGPRACRIVAFSHPAASVALVVVVASAPPPSGYSSLTLPVSLLPPLSLRWRSPPGSTS